MVPCYWEPSSPWGLLANTPPVCVLSVPQTPTRQRPRHSSGIIVDCSSSNSGGYGPRMSVASPAELTIDWLESRMGLDAREARDLADRYPPIRRDSMEKLEMRLVWLQKRLALDDAQVSKMAAAFPWLFQYTVEDNLEPKLQWLQSRLGLDDADLGRMLMVMPTILGLSIEGNMKPKLRWLEETLGIDAASSAKMVVRCPSIFAHAEANLGTKVGFLKEDLCLGRRSVVRILRSHPHVLSHSIDANLKPKVRFFFSKFGERERGVGLTRLGFGLSVHKPHLLGGGDTKTLA